MKPPLIIGLVWLLWTALSLTPFGRQLDQWVWQVIGQGYGHADFWLVITFLGEGPFLMVLSLVFSLVFFWRLNRRVTLLFLLGVLVTQLSNSLWKQWIGQLRPPGSPFLATVGPWAYPSGHAAVSVFAYGGLGLLWWALRPQSFWGQRFFVAGLMLALLISLSRLVLGVHWFSDVVGGYLWGLFVLACLRLLLFKGSVSSHLRQRR